MKKLLCILLCLSVMSSALPIPACADEAVRSMQQLTVDGRAVECGKYAISGYNYFKLRDVACLLSGTGSQFSVDWDPADSTIRIETGSAYVPVGGELAPAGEEMPEAMPSSQTVRIDGVIREGISAYVIGGNNYFRLRDLGSLLGFDVDYAETANTAMIRSLDPAPLRERQLYLRIAQGIREHVGIGYPGSGRAMTADIIDLRDFELSNAAGGADRELLWQVFERVFYDHPEFFCLQEGYYRALDSQGGIIGIVPQYFSFAREASSLETLQAQFDAALNAAMAAAGESNAPAERVLAVYNYLVAGNAVPWSDAARKAADSGALACSAYGALAAGDSTSKGMALAFKAAADRLNDPGISCKVVFSEASGRFWNLVSLDGVWYHLDASRGGSDPPALRGYTSYQAFLISDSTARTLGYDHWGSPSLPELPTCSSTQYEQGTACSGVFFPVYRQGEQYYSIRHEGGNRFGLFSGALDGTGQRLASLPLLTGGNLEARTGVVWHDGSLYYVDQDKCLQRYDLSSGVETRLLTVPFVPSTSSDSIYTREKDAIGLYYDAARESIVAVSRTRQQELAAWPLGSSRVP